MAFSSAESDRADARVALAGAVLGVTGVVAAIAFGASLATLLHSPRLYGQAYDASITAPDAVQARVFAAQLSDRGIDALAIRHEGILEFIGPRGAVDHASVQAIEPLRGAIAPVIADGRQPDTPDEVAIGTYLQRRLGLHLGDVVELYAAHHRSMRVVGTYVVPDGNYANRNALLTTRAYDDLIAPYYVTLLVKLRAGLPISAQLSGLRVVFAQTPSSVGNLNELGRVPLTSRRVRRDTGYRRSSARPRILDPATALPDRRPARPRIHPAPGPRHRALARRHDRPRRTRPRPPAWDRGSPSTMASTYQPARRRLRT